MEDFKIIIDTIEELMKNSVAHLDKSFLNIRAGKATPMMLNSVSIDYFGTNTPINQVANINTPNSQTISVQPWDKSIIPEIEKAIITSNLGFNPMNNGESVIINVPPLTEDRRKDLVKQAKAEAENSKIKQSLFLFLSLEVFHQLKKYNYLLDFEYQVLRFSFHLQKDLNF
jgi:ribosome recycling factor